jgi:hypothetical protein
VKSTNELRTATKYYHFISNADVNLLVKTQYYKAALLVASNDVDIEVNADRTKYKFRYRHRNVGRNNNRKVINKS